MKFENLTLNMEALNVLNPFTTNIIVDFFTTT